MLARPHCLSQESGQQYLSQAYILRDPWPLPREDRGGCNDSDPNHKGWESAGACVWLVLYMNPSLTAEVTFQGVERVKTGLCARGGGRVCTPSSIHRDGGDLRKQMPQHQIACSGPKRQSQEGEREEKMLSLYSKCLYTLKHACSVASAHV